MKSYSFLKKYLLAATATAALLFSACDLDEHPTSFVGPRSTTRPGRNAWRA